MKRTLTTTIAIGTAALALALAGCEKKKEEGTGGEAAGGSAESGGSASAPGAKASPAAVAATMGAKGFAVFPADSGMLVGINFQSVRKSGLWSKYKGMVEKQIAGEMAEFKEACGIDPLTQLESAIVAANPSTDSAVVVVKGINRSALTECGKKLAEADGKKIEVTDEGNLSNYKVDGESIWVAWIDDKTMVMAPEKDKDYLAARVAGTDGLADGSKLMAMLKSVDTGASVYIVGDVAAMGPGAAAMPGAEGMFASIKLTDGLAVDAGLRFGSAEGAKGMTDMANQQMKAMKGSLPPPFQKLIDKASIKTVDKDMVVQISLSGSELEEVGKAAEGMMGALGGFGGL